MIIFTHQIQLVVYLLLYRSARQDGRPSPTVSNPLFGHAPAHVQYDEPIQQQHSVSQSLEKYKEFLN